MPPRSAPRNAPETPRTMTQEDESKRAQAELARLQKLVEMMSQHGLVELELKPDGTVKMRKQEERRDPAPAPMWMPGPWMAPPAAAAPAPSATPAAAAAPAPAPESAPAAPKKELGLTEFKSPIVGTFYRKPAPDKEAFVDRGARVRPDSVICIIEAMKVMNEIRAEISGEVVDILVKDGEAVEYGQPLFLIRPA